jgi:hypothetical protein
MFILVKTLGVGRRGPDLGIYSSTSRASGPKKRGGVRIAQGNCCDCLRMLGWVCYPTAGIRNFYSLITLLYRICVEDQFVNVRQVAAQIEFIAKPHVIDKIGALNKIERKMIDTKRRFGTAAGE